MKLNRKYLALITLVIVTSSWNVLAGSKANQETAPSSATISESNSGMSGQELWSNNCQRCHNMRSPAMYTPVQWEVIVLHMRVRANITGADHRAITDFLKSASR